MYKHYVRYINFCFDHLCYICAWLCAYNDHSAQMSCFILCTPHLLVDHLYNLTIFFRQLLTTSILTTSVMSRLDHMSLHTPLLSNTHSSIVHMPSINWLPIYLDHFRWSITDHLVRGITALVHHDKATFHFDVTDFLCHKFYKQILQFNKQIPVYMLHFLHKPFKIVIVISTKTAEKSDFNEVSQSILTI